MTSCMAESNARQIDNYSKPFQALYNLGKCDVLFLTLLWIFNKQGLSSVLFPSRSVAQSYLTDPSLQDEKLFADLYLILKVLC